MRVGDVPGVAGRAVVTVEPDDTIADVVFMLKEHAIGAVVVSGDGRKILGIISERDVVRHLVLEHEHTLRVKVEDLMTEDVSTCRLDDELDATVGVMTRGRFRHMPVVDDTGALVSIVSLGDLVDARMKRLEAELGDLVDARMKRLEAELGDS